MRRVQLTPGDDEQPRRLWGFRDGRVIAAAEVSWVIHQPGHPPQLVPTQRAAVEVLLSLGAERVIETDEHGGEEVVEGARAGLARGGTR